jgi:hypothetical protein
MISSPLRHPLTPVASISNCEFSANMSPPTPSDRMDVSTANTSLDTDKPSSSESDQENPLYDYIRVTRAQARFFFPPLPEKCIIPDDQAHLSRGFVGLACSWSDR